MAQPRRGQRGSHGRDRAGADAVAGPRSRATARAKPRPAPAQREAAPPPPVRRPPTPAPTPAPASKAAPAGTLWIYGRHAVAAILANPARRCRRVVALPEAAEDLLPLIASARADLPEAAPERIDRRALERLLPEGAVHQGVAVAADPLPRPELGDLVAALPEEGAPHIVVLLDQVSDPHNVGAILRSAAAFGALAVVLPEHGAPALTGVMAKAASGALETVPLVRAGNLARAIARLKEAGFWCVGLDAGAPESLASLGLPDRIALVLGAEGGGLRRLTRESCDFLAHLPTRGTLASLNVSNAAAVALYALAIRSPGR